MASKPVAKKSVKKVVTQKPVRKVEKAPLGDVLVTLDRVITFLDHATVALNKFEATMQNFSRMTANVAVGKVLGEEAAKKVEAVPMPAQKNEVEHTPSYNIVIKKLPTMATHAAIDILLGQVKASVKLTKEEQDELVRLCAVRKNEIPF